MIDLAFDKMGGLIPAIVQDHASGDVLMLAYMNAEAFEATLATGEATFFSRSRQELWIKGKTSGHVQRVKSVHIDCDQDAILVRVEQVGGAACHTGYRSCFYRRVEEQNLIIDDDPVFDPKEVYKK
ncbi:MAG: phosphoribosyl-AMP cyclohydrolase [Desulfobacterales bacterium]|nr:phosphoribosyl-AMP cyclohydrolase [Desulfobacterales bacterium]